MRNTVNRLGERLQSKYFTKSINSLKIPASSKRWKEIKWITEDKDKYDLLGFSPFVNQRRHVHVGRPHRYVPKSVSVDLEPLEKWNDIILTSLDQPVQSDQYIVELDVV